MHQTHDNQVGNDMVIRRYIIAYIRDNTDSFFKDEWGRGTAKDTTVESYCAGMLIDSGGHTAFMDLDMIQAFSDLTGAAFQIITDTIDCGAVARHQAMIIPKDDRIVHVCHLIYSMNGHYRPCIRITDTGDSRDTTPEEILLVARMVESLRIQRAEHISAYEADISAYEAADLVAQQARESDEAVRIADEAEAAAVVAAAVGLDQDAARVTGVTDNDAASAYQEAAHGAGEAAAAEAVVPERTQAKPLNNRQRRAARKADAEALTGAVEEVPPRASMATDEKASEEALEEVVQQQTVPKARKIQETGQTSAGWEQPKQGQRGVASDHECPTPSADGRDVHDQGFNFVTAPGFQPTPGAEGIEAHESSPPTNPLESDSLEENTVPLHSDSADGVVTYEQTRTGQHNAEAPQCPPEFRAGTSTSKTTQDGNRTGPPEPARSLEFLQASILRTMLVRQLDAKLKAVDILQDMFRLMQVKRQVLRQIELWKRQVSRERQEDRIAHKIAGLRSKRTKQVNAQFGAAAFGRRGGWRTQAR